MNRIKKIFLLLFVLPVLSSCIKPENIFNQSSNENISFPTSFPELESIPESIPSSWPGTLPENIDVSKIKFTYYLNDGTDKVHWECYPKNNRLDLPENPVREGYTFKAWASSPVNLYPFDFDCDVREYINSPSLYAIWAKDELTNFEDFKTKPSSDYYISVNRNGVIKYLDMTEQPFVLPNYEGDTKLIRTEGINLKRNDHLQFFYKGKLIKNPKVENLEGYYLSSVIDNNHFRVEQDSENATISLIDYLDKDVDFERLINFELNLGNGVFKDFNYGIDEELINTGVIFTYQGRTKGFEMENITTDSKDGNISCYYLEPLYIKEGTLVSFKYNGEIVETNLICNSGQKISNIGTVDKPEYYLTKTLFGEETLLKVEDNKFTFMIEPNVKPSIPHRYTICNFTPFEKNLDGVIYVWVWGENRNGYWVESIIEGNNLLFEPKETIIGFLLASFEKGTTEPDWESPTNYPYAKTSDINTILNIYDYDMIEWIELYFRK